MSALKENLIVKEKKGSVKKLSDNQKANIKGFKDTIINSDNVIVKYRAYLMLINYLENALQLNKPIYKHDINIDYKVANAKISKKDTIIFSFGTALICYSAIKGYCQLYKNKKCYALRNELQYNTSVLYKHRQYKQFKKLKAWQLARAFIKIKRNEAKKGNNIKYIRINESADIQKKHFNKLNKISDILKKHGIKIYTYTHNREVKQSDIKSDNLTINSSNKQIKLGNRFLSYDHAKVKRIMQSKKDKKIIECIADCSKCKACTIANNLTILCNIH